MFVLLLSATLCYGEPKTDSIEAGWTRIETLVASDQNGVAPFMPRVTCDSPGDTRRHTPLLQIQAPWEAGQTYELEVPEYTWARVPGDPHNGDPFFYGRKIGNVADWVVRYPSLEEPAWQRGPKGSASLDVPLEGGYVQRFRVIPRDRAVEVRFGISNNSPKPLTSLRAQLCMTSPRVTIHRERWPTSSAFLCQGSLVTWDTLGQDLSWLDAHRNGRSGRFDQSCFFLAPLEGYEPRGFPEKERARKDLMWFNRAIDVPAIAKVDPDTRRKAVVVYSPHGCGAFFNVLVPCFHADPQMNMIAAGETRWTASYFFFFDGDLERLFRDLAEVHKELARVEGYASSEH